MPKVSLVRDRGWLQQPEHVAVRISTVCRPVSAAERARRGVEHDAGSVETFVFLVSTGYLNTEVGSPRAITSIPMMSR